MSQEYRDTDDCEKQYQRDQQLPMNRAMTTLWIDEAISSVFLAARTINVTMTATVSRAVGISRFMNRSSFTVGLRS